MWLIPFEPPKRNLDVTDDVKLECSAMSCMNNLSNINYSFGCNLKFIQIDDDGKCTHYHPKECDDA